MKATLSFGVLSLCSLRAAAHGHHHEEAAEAGMNYAEKHMSKEHHIDTFDTRSFFQLHDLNRDGFWNKEEVEAVYGVHHVYSQKKSKDEVEHQNKADQITDTVLKAIDTDKDGKISAEELDKVGLAGLPNFDQMGAEGHHYDVESEFFLHHEEEFHSTPETQTDDSYNHPEDIEHFAHHERIEREEAEREAKYQGVTVEEVLESHEPHDHEEQQQQQEQHQEEGEQHDVPPEVAPAKEVPESNPKITRVPPPEQLDPQERYKTAKSDGDRKGEWGTGSEGFKPPTEPGDRMRKNLPYKYKFRRNWGDF